MYSSGHESSSSDDLFYSNDQFPCGKSKFRFPSPPRVSVSETNSISSFSVSSNDSRGSVCSCETTVKKSRRQSGYHTRQPPLGIFWDIENCQVPKSKSAGALVQKIRAIFLKRYREWEFVVVCDVKKEQPHIIQELHDSQVHNIVLIKFIFKFRL